METNNILFLYGQVATFIYIFSEIIVNIKPFRNVVARNSTTVDKLIIILLFGAFSIIGTYLGIKIPSGAILNVRDLGPMIAGFIGGPAIGLGAGLIGGVHRFFMGGPTAFACGLSTILAGLICGFYHLKTGGKPVGIFRGMVAAALIEALHMGVVLAVARPFTVALETVRIAGFPMIAANAIGMFFSLKAISYTVKTAVTPDQVSDTTGRSISSSAE